MEGRTVQKESPEDPAWWWISRGSIRPTCAQSPFPLHPCSGHCHCSRDGLEPGMHLTASPLARGWPGFLGQLSSLLFPCPHLCEGCIGGQGERRGHHSGHQASTTLPPHARGKSPHHRAPHRRLSVCAGKCHRGTLEPLPPPLWDFWCGSVCPVGNFRSKFQVRCSHSSAFHGVRTTGFPSHQRRYEKHPV